MDRSKTAITIATALLALCAWVAVAPAAQQNAPAPQQGELLSQPQSDNIQQSQGRQQTSGEVGQGTGGTQDFQQQSSGRQQPQAQPSGQQMQQEWRSPHGWQKLPDQRQQGWQQQPDGQEWIADDQWQQKAGEPGQDAQSDRQQGRQQRSRQQDQPSWRTQQQDESRWLQDQGAGGSRGQPQTDAADQQQPPGALTMGKLVDTREVRVQGQEQPFLLAKIATRSGRTVIANLGPRDQLPKSVRLQRGEQVAITGQLGRINDQPVIIAHTFANVVDLEPQWANLRQLDQRTFQRQQIPQQQRQQDTFGQDEQMDRNQRE